VNDITIATLNKVLKGAKQNEHTYETEMKYFKCFYHPTHAAPRFSVACFLFQCLHVRGQLVNSHYIDFCVEKGARIGHPWG